jgi:hypothetical protein
MTILPGKLYAFTGAFLLLSIFTRAQGPAVNGSVTDTLNKTTLHNAVVYLKDPKDSSLVNYTRADERGRFVMNKVPSGTYIMVVTYPNFVDWIDSITVKTEPVTVPVYLTTKTHLLQEVIVKQTIPPIRVKGDTTIYMADSFKVRPGATVEDLLKILPGMSVNSKGEITTKGQKVQKVLVDGDEFFGDDPTMATQNLNAKDVAKVEVYDKKSDQATLTGIDDGTKQKTVNLVMKEDAKKGYFGTAQAGTDFDKYYQAKVTANRFTSTAKAGILFTADRTGRNAMSWEEMQDFGSISSTVENGEVQYSWDGDSDFGPWGQQGIPENLQVAAMMNKKFGKLKSSTANNASYNHLNLAGEGYSQSKYILADTVNYNTVNRSNKSSKWKQNFSTKNNFNIDSLTTISLNARGSFGRNESISFQDGQYLAGDATTLINTSKRVNSSTGDNHGGKADVFLTRKLNAAGTRSFTLGAGMATNYNNSQGYLLNQTDFYTNGSFSSQQIVDQRKTSTNETNTVQALASYTEPLSRKMSLNLNYTFNSSRNDQDSRSFEKQNGKYDSLNPLFSNHYLFNNSSNRGGFMINYITKDITAKLGMAVQDLKLKQTNVYKDSSFARNFTNFFPAASVKWKYSTSGGLNVSYNGYTQQPSLMQLQPILNNNDPLNIILGNQNLQPSFQHRFNFDLSDYKTLKNRGIWSYGGVSFTENAFSQKSTVDAAGRKVTQTVNVNGNYNYYGRFSYQFQLKKIKLDLDLGPYIDGYHNTSFVNGVENETNSFNVSQSFSIGRYIEKKLSLRVYYDVGYNNSISSINPNAKTDYWTQNVGFYFNYYFNAGLQINSNADYNYRQKLSENDRNPNTFVWNASVEKKLMKKKDVVLILSVNDILNQRIGFNRDISSNYITESGYTTVQRYAMLSLRWKFNKNKKTSDYND